MGENQIGDPQKIKELDFDYVVLSILSEEAVKSARRDLKLMGIKEDKIKWIDSNYIRFPEKLLKEAQYKGEKMFDIG